MSQLIRSVFEEISWQSVENSSDQQLQGTQIEGCVSDHAQVILVREQPGTYSEDSAAGSNQEVAVSPSCHPADVATAAHDQPVRRKAGRKTRRGY